MSDYMINSIESFCPGPIILDFGTQEDGKNNEIINDTLLKLPAEIRKEVLDNVIFVLISPTKQPIYGITQQKSFPLKLKSDDFNLNEEEYSLRGQKVFILLNFMNIADEEKMHTIAHEIAHFCLGHYKRDESVPGCINLKLETEADCLSEKWGFKPMYKSKDSNKTKWENLLDKQKLAKNKVD